MGWDEYRGLPALNWSLLKHMRVSPLACWQAMHEPSEDTTGRLIGRAVHALVLEGCEDFVVFEGDRRGKAWTEFRDQHNGRSILRAVEADTVRAMADAVRHHHAAAALLRRVKGEVPLAWMSATKCKGLADGLGDGVLLDLKTCGPLAVFARRAWADGYVHQLAWYRYGARAMGHTVNDVYLVGVEAKAPHDVGVWRLSDSALDHAQREVLGLEMDFIECRESGLWPGAFPDVVEMGLPAWVLDDSDDDVKSFGEVGDE